jgi:hypothetical protein
MANERIREGFDVFTQDGDKAFGAVRLVAPDGRPELVIFVENAGHFTIPFTAVLDVHSPKVIVNCSRVGRPLRQAIGHAHDPDDPRLP